MRTRRTGRERRRERARRPGAPKYRIKRITTQAAPNLMLLTAGCNSSAVGAGRFGIFWRQPSHQPRVSRERGGAEAPCDFRQRKVVRGTGGKNASRGAAIDSRHEHPRPIFPLFSNRALLLRQQEGAKDWSSKARAIAHALAGLPLTAACARSWRRGARRWGTP